MLCEFETTDNGDGTFSQLCKRCGHSATTTTERYYNGCSVVGWGDRLKAAFARRGITKELYAAARGRHRVVGGMNCVLVELPPDEPTCNCDERQAWLNRWGNALVNRWWPT